MKRGFVCGAWDLLHPGHLYLLEECKKRCDILIVGLHINPSLERIEKSEPVQTVYERYIQLRSCKYVNCIVPYETEQDLTNILILGEFTVRFLGSDYEGRLDTTGYNLVPITYIPRLHSFSSTDLRERLKV